MTHTCGLSDTGSVGGISGSAEDETRQSRQRSTCHRKPKHARVFRCRGTYIHRSKKNIRYSKGRCYMVITREKTCARQNRVEVGREILKTAIVTSTEVTSTKVASTKVTSAKVTSTKISISGVIVEYVTQQQTTGETTK